MATWGTGLFVVVVVAGLLLWLALAAVVERRERRRRLVARLASVTEERDASGREAVDLPAAHRSAASYGVAELSIEDYAAFAEASRERPSELYEHRVRRI